MFGKSKLNPITENILNPAYKFADRQQYKKHK